MRVLVCAAAAACLGGAAHAQTPRTNFEQMLGIVSRWCLEAMSDANQTAEARLSTCETGLASVERLGAAQDNPSALDRNYYNFLRSFMHTSIANSQARIDGGRTARVCDNAEKSWAAASLINPADSPEAMHKSLQTAREAAIAIARACRAHNGPPPGAPALP